MNSPLPRAENSASRICNFALQRRIVRITSTRQLCGFSPYSIGVNDSFTGRFVNCALKHNLKSVYSNVRTRCLCKTSPRYKDYGGRGITICDEWSNGFNAFALWATTHGYRPGLQLDRIDNERGYSPDNCRFVDARANASNRRNTIRVTIDGATMCLKEACRRIGANYRQVHHRVRDYGWSVAEALYTPINPYSKQPHLA